MNQIQAMDTPQILHNRSVLIVDDNPQNLRVVETSLEPYQCELFIARTGQQALVRAAQNQPDIILLDIVLPDIDGFEVCQTIKANPVIAHIPVIFMTVLDDIDDKVRGFHVGAVDYITKPINRDELIMRVSTHLQLHLLRESLEAQVAMRTRELEEANEQLKREIAVRQQAELTLASQNAFLSALLDTVPEGILLQDELGKVLLANKSLAANLNRPVAEIIGQHVSALFPADLLEAMQPRPETLHQSQEIFLDGTPPKYCQIVHVPIQYDEQTEATIVTVCHDITAVKQAEQKQIELRMATERNQFLKEFLGNISHDIKTPITVIRSSFYLYERHQEADAKQKYLQRVKEQVVRLERLVEDILTLARLDQLPIVESTLVELVAVVEDVVANLVPVAENKGLALETAVETQLLVRGHEPDLRTAVTNIIENAVHYTPDGGTIRITGSKAAGWIQLMIADTGMGIATEDQEKIFERFYRTRGARAGAVNGTGLGLAIVKRVVDMHHGRIGVQSTVGEGTTFLLEFPSVS